MIKIHVDSRDVTSIQTGDSSMQVQVDEAGVVHATYESM